MTNVVGFPQKYDPEDVSQFLQKYHEEITGRECGHRPTAVLIVEYYKDEKMDATIYNVEVGGQVATEVHALVGILEMAKHRLMTDTQTVVS